MGETELHRPNISPRGRRYITGRILQQFVHISPDSAKDFEGLGIGYNINSGHLVLDVDGQVLVEDREGIALVVLGLFLEKALEGFGDFSLYAGCGG